MNDTPSPEEVDFGNHLELFPAEVEDLDDEQVIVVQGRDEEYYSIRMKPRWVCEDNVPQAVSEVETLNRELQHSTSAESESESEEVLQEDIVDGLQEVKGVGPQRALAAVGQMNATEWTDLLDSESPTELLPSVEDSLSHGSVDTETVRIVVVGKAREYNPDWFGPDSDSREAGEGQ
ncbi:hypothetical protein JMJ58_03640 [Haloterrigena salifodinae]|uniref:Uncharacterized protein n=1 Tax=Haloterrigena salifodinae TaxID=2675099 RepID=A0A8T8E3M9_9EURY|nr:hypothetical protein [Haloterrigena salifodinae]QRV16001.1 hypothetical protein JMJ58_03640 [Haloterrigena salifodinae]